MTSRISMCHLFLAVIAGTHTLAQATSTSGAERSIPKISSAEVAEWIDQRFAADWKSRGLDPPPVVDNATFMRRVYLDLIGTIPCVPEVRDFLYASGSFKREDLIDRLLNDERRPEQFATRSAAHLARIWRRAMIARNSPNADMADAFEPWLQEQFASNVPYDQLARNLITATPVLNPVPSRTGEAVSGPIQVFYQANGGTPVTTANAVTRYFLGVRIGCAQCHPHPFSSWQQEDFWGMAAFFTDSRGNGKLPSITDEVGTSYEAKFLWSDEISIPGDKSPRDVLADWLVSPENPNFAATAVNRIWQHLCGRGIVAQVDDLDQYSGQQRAVLDELAQMFAESGYNVRWLTEGICKSQYYQRTSLSQDADADARLGLRPLKTLTPEQVFDSLEQALALPVGRVDNPPRYNGLRNTFVARMDEAASESPDDYRAGIPQALMIMNGKLTADATSLEKSHTLRAIVDAPFLKPAEKIETLFLAALTRVPSDEELEFLLKHIHSQPSDSARGRAYEEVFWGLLNSPEFMLSR